MGDDFAGTERADNETSQTKVPRSASFSTGDVNQVGSHGTRGLKQHNSRSPGSSLSFSLSFSLFLSLFLSLSLSLSLSLALLLSLPLALSLSPSVSPSDSLSLSLSLSLALPLPSYPKIFLLNSIWLHPHTPMASPLGLPHRSASQTHPGPTI